MINLFEIFKTIAAEESGRLTINGDDEELEKQANAQESIYRLYIPYKKEEICVEYAVGAQHVASTSLILETMTNCPEFEITTRSPFFILFMGKKDRIKVSCKDLKLKKKISLNPHLAQINKLSDNTAFEPNTFAENKKFGFEIRTEYHLVFPKRTKEIRPLIQFYKDLIDYLRE